MARRAYELETSYVHLIVSSSDTSIIAERATHNLANAPLNAAQTPLAIAKKIHCVRVLHWFGLAAGSVPTSCSGRLGMFLAESAAAAVSEFGL